MELARYVIEDRDGTPTRLLVMLHGYGATEHDLAPLGPLLDPDGHVLVVGLRAPLPVEGAGWSWFDSGARGPSGPSFRDTIDKVDAAIAELCVERGMRRHEVVLAGFSQGGAVALAAAMADLDLPPVAGVLAWSTWLPEVEGVEYGWDRAAGLSVLVQHGERDERVHVELGRGTALALEHHGVPVTYREYDMAHQTTLESLTDARAWLEQVRSGARPSSPVVTRRHP